MTLNSEMETSTRRSAIETTLFFVALGLVWEYSVRLFGIKSYLLPRLSDILVECWRSRSLLFEHGLVTLGEVVFGFLAAVFFGTLLALAVFFVPVARRTLYPLVIALQSVPKVGLAPLLVVWLGYGLSSKVLMVFFFAFFPIVIATLGGLANTPAHLLEHFRALGATGWTTFRRLRVPSALPNFLDGCKVAMPLAVIGAVVGEFVGSNDGLGNLILVSTGASRTALTFAALGAVTAISLFLFFLVDRFASLVWWRAR